jgi:hypothetical protein
MRVHLCLWARIILQRGLQSRHPVGIAYKQRSVHNRPMELSPRDPPAPRRLACVRCGTAFDCGLGGDCWCITEPFRLPMPAGNTEDCLCPTCLRAAAAAAGHGV